MKLLVFSDTHLTEYVEEKKFNLLSDIISKADRVVINGDFWDGYLSSFDEFIHSGWKNLFPLLKKKKAVYVYGNHDHKHFQHTQKSKLFSEIQTDRFKIKIGNKTFIFEHGNRLLPFGDEEVFQAQIKSKLNRLSNTIEGILIKTLGVHYQRFLQKYNEIIKTKLVKELKKNEFYVCGHTHSAEVDIKNRFINSGVIKDGLAQYIHISEKGFTPNNVIYY
ncbi:hypothetical protein BH09PAT2_BH09PAT2_06590 [soil metagenome]